MQDAKRENIISEQAADKLIAAHDGDVALLYIYFSRNGCQDTEQAARDLCRTLREIEAAAEKLQRMGLLDAPAQKSPTAEKAELPLPADELPQYTGQEIARRAKGDPIFMAIQDEAVKVIGKQLSSPDQKILFGIYDHLALPPEVILEMLNYCGELFQEKYGTGRRPTMHVIEKEAYTWVNRELMTLELAEEYIREQKERRGSIGRIKAMLGIYGRELSSLETKAISSWLDMGFGEEAISLAYDRTVLRTGGFKLNYMSKILQSWHDNGLHSPAEIEEKDPIRTKPAAAAGKSRPIDLRELDDIFDKI